MKTLLLVNLGSPNSPEVKDVAVYLKQFLMDPFVIDVPLPLRWLLVKGLIVPRRAPNSAEAYKTVWTENGSPLVHATEELATKLKHELPDWRVEWAMRYGEPDLRQTMGRLVDEGVEELYVWPLYPQYAKSSVATSLDVVQKVLKQKNSNCQVHYVKDFYDAPFFIEPLAQNGKSTQESFHPDHILFSFHGLPEHHITELDETKTWCLKQLNCCASVTDKNRRCYRAQCYATARALAQAGGLEPAQYTVAFQSRLGRRPWIRPYTDVVISELIKKGVKRLMVFCPSFVADCLETLEEIQIRLREQFIEEGGEDLILVPSLNASDEWVASMKTALDQSQLEWMLLQ